MHTFVRVCVCVCNEEKGKNNCCSELFSPPPHPRPPTTPPSFYSRAFLTFFARIRRQNTDRLLLLRIFVVPGRRRPPRLIGVLFGLCRRARLDGFFFCFSAFRVKAEVFLFLVRIRRRSIRKKKHRSVTYCLGRPIFVGNVAFESKLSFVGDGYNRFAIGVDRTGRFGPRFECL